MSGMSALLAYGYILTYDHEGQWEELLKPDYLEDIYEMDWPDWVDPDDIVSSMQERLNAHFKGESPVTVDFYGNFSWAEVPVVLYVTESKHEADDAPEYMENFIWSSTAWSTYIYEALLALEIELKKREPKWFLAPSYSS